MKKVCKQHPDETLVLSDPTKQRDEEQMPCSDLNSGKKRSRFWGINPFVHTWTLGSIGPSVGLMSWPTVVQPVVPAVPAVPAVPGGGLGPVIAALRSKAKEETKVTEDCQSNSQRSLVEKGGGPVMNGTELMEAMKKVCKQHPNETLVLSDPTKQRDEEQMPCSDLNSGKKRSRFWGINPFVHTWTLG